MLCILDDDLRGLEQPTDMEGMQEEEEEVEMEFRQELIDEEDSGMQLRLDTGQLCCFSSLL